MIGIAKQDLVNSEFIIEEGILKCDICGKKFAHFSRLNAHKQFHNIHSEENIRWSSCHLCGKSPSDFSDNVNLYTFQREKINVCDLCITETERTGTIYETFTRNWILKQEIKHGSKLTQQGSIKNEMDIDNMFANQMVVLDEAIEVSTEEIVTEEIGIDHEEVIEMKKEKIFTPLKLTETPQVPVLQHSTDSLTLGQNDSGIEPGTYVFCKFCRAYVVKNFILKHQRDVHFVEDKWKRLKSEQDSSTKILNQQDQLACEECGKPFTSKRAMYGHKREFHSGIVQKHKCPQCGKDFARRTNLKAHQDLVHLGKTYPCSVCKQNFTNPSTMRRHRKNIHYEWGM